MSKYVSPMVRARAVVAGQIPASKADMDNCVRMVNLHSMIISDLEREEAPVRVFRWVAWGSTRAEQRRRTDLVMFLRRSIERPRNGWFRERHFAAALAEWDRKRAEARKRGGIMPNFDQIPLETYQTVIEAAQKRPRARTSEIEMTAAGSEDGGEPPVEEDDDEDEIEEQIEEAPASDVQPRRREHVLKCLSDAVRAAIAADDMEAADAANDAISRLCGGRDDSE